MSLVNLENYRLVVNWLRLGTYPKHFHIWKFIDELLIEFPQIKDAKKTTWQVIQEAEHYVIQKELNDV